MTLDSDHSSPSGQNSDGEGGNFGGDASLMTHVNRRAMATEFAVILPAHLADAVELVVETLEQLDANRKCADDLPGRQRGLARRTVWPPIEPVELSPETFALLQKSDRLERTDRMALLTLRRDHWLKLGVSLGEADASQRTRRLRRHLNWLAINRSNLSVPQRTVRFAKAGMSINLGAIGKGDALDRLAGQLRRRGLTDFLIHGGNSSVIAAGSQTLDSEHGMGGRRRAPDQTKTTSGRSVAARHGVGDERFRKAVLPSSRTSLRACDRPENWIPRRRPVVVDGVDGVGCRCGRLCNRFVCCRLRSDRRDDDGGLVPAADHACGRATGRTQSRSSRAVMSLGSMTRSAKFHKASQQIKSLRVKHVSRRDSLRYAIPLDFVVSDELQAARIDRSCRSRQVRGSRLTHDHTEHRERCLT